MGNINSKMPGGRMKSGGLGAVLWNGFTKGPKKSQTESDKRAYEKRVAKRRAKKKS